VVRKGKEKGAMYLASKEKPLGHVDVVGKKGYSGKRRGRKGEVWGIRALFD